MSHDQIDRTEPAERAEVDFDHTDPAIVADGHGTFRDMRERCPVAHSDKLDGFWVFSKYEDLTAAARNPRVFCSSGGVTIPDFGAPVPMAPIETDPPIHTAFRQLLQREFSRTRMQQMEQPIRDLANRLIDDFIADGRADFSTQLAQPLPSIVIAELFGFPSTDWERFRVYTETMLETAKSGDLEGNIGAALEFCSFLAEALDERRAHPRDDMLTRVTQAAVDGRPITEDEALGLTLLTVVAGHETTVGGIGFLLMHVARAPEIKRRIVEEPTLIARAIEETLRMEAPIQGIARTVTEDVTVRDQQLRAGEKVWLLWASGNRDADKFEDPDTFRLDRRINRHLGFGDGIHRCVGAPLAQLEMRVVLEEVLKRMPDFRIEDESALTFGGGQNRLATHLPIVWSTPTD